MKKILKNLEKKGFTLVELIIVIAIIAVLAVSAFMVLTKWLGSSRDSRRISDANTIQSALNIHLSDLDNSNGLLPIPDDAVEIKFSGDIIGYQGNFGQETISELDNMQKIPLDPRGDEYTYYISANRKKFQILIYLENDNKLVYNRLINTVLANDNTTKYEKVFGHNLGIITDGNQTPIQNLEITELELKDNTDQYEIIFKDNKVSGEAQSLMPVIALQQNDETLMQLDGNLIGYWNMETIIDGKLKDLSGNGNNATANGSVSAGNINGKYGKATTFDGIDDYFNLTPDKFSDVGDQLTISAWVKRDLADTSGGIVSKFGDVGKRSFRLTMNGTNAYFTTITSSQIQISKTLSDSEWHFMVGVYDGSKIDLYYDGEKISTSAQSGNITTNALGEFRIGGQDGSHVGESHFLGAIDEVRIYDRPLSENEISVLYEMND